MEDQKLLDLDTNILEPAPKLISSDPDDDLLSEDIKPNFQDDNSDLILMPEKVVGVEKLSSLENMLVIEQEPKENIDTEVDIKVDPKDDHNIMSETETLLSPKPYSYTLDDIPSAEIPKMEEKDYVEPVEITKEEPKIIDVPKTEFIPKKEIEVKMDTVLQDDSTVVVKTDSADKGDVCDIKIGPEELFSRIGLDKWFNPEKLPPQVEALVYWRNPVSSGAVFATILTVLLSFSYMSLFSVVAYIGLGVQIGSLLVRLYYTVMQTVNKASPVNNPLQFVSDLDVRLPEEKAEELSKLIIVHLNAVLVELRRLLIVEDLVDSAKLFGILWVMTYVGAWFNGLTLIIIGFLALFTLPKVYESNKTQIDQNIDLVRSKIADLTNKVRAAIPIGKKETEAKKKE
ncbi:reticulon-1-B-like [Adelges cooleyi]|uniref:reticulon-1-B-like n=1 Tax=Adelges cooleyi TaxID=133065 RepID=UPI00217F3088|nr:reticulon-1-B-like [Adelges cooleyi]